MSIQYKNCKNCENDFRSNFDFCPHCGMKAKEELTLGVLFYNTVNNYLLYDSKFFKSFIPLMVKPGFLPNTFIAGKRLSFLHPAQLYLFVTFVFFFFFSFVSSKEAALIDEEFGKNKTEVKNVLQQQKEDSLNRASLYKALKDTQTLTGKTDKEIDSIISNKAFTKNKAITFDYENKEIDSLIAINAPNELIYKSMGMEDDPNFFDRIWYPQLLKFHKQQNVGSLLKTMIDATPIALFILLPIFAFLLKLFYWKKGRYAYHLVFTFYYFAFLFVAFNLLLALEFLLEHSAWIDFIVLLSTFIYLLIAIKRFYKQSWFLSFVKSGTISFLFILLVMPIAFVVLGFISFLFY